MFTLLFFCLSAMEFLCINIPHRWCILVVNILLYILDWAEINLSFSGCCKREPKVGCPSARQFWCSSYEYTHNCTFICLPGNRTKPAVIQHWSGCDSLYLLCSECSTCCVYESWREPVKSKVKNFIINYSLDVRYSYQVFQKCNLTNLSVLSLAWLLVLYYSQ